MTDLRSYLMSALLMVLALACAPSVPDVDMKDDSQAENKTDVPVFEPSFGTSVYGTVLCDGVPVSGVVVSDGYECDQTDKDGYYQLQSLKKHGYVFISVPSGYTVAADGALPVFHRYLNEDASRLERVDFNILKDEGQENHTMVILGDIQLAGINNDFAQFSKFVTDLNDHMEADQSRKFYGLTVGDMSYDRYWLSKGVDLYDYLSEIGRLNDIPVYNTIGNHDHEQMSIGDFYSAAIYKVVIGPTYYSFNIGEVHYVVLDNIECTNPGTGDITYNEKLVQEQIQWLKKDLSYIPKQTPVVVALHSPVFRNDASASGRMENYDLLVEALSGRNVHYMTGHTHVMYNVEKPNQYEHNVGAICGTWWKTGQEIPGIHISTDGTPGGYLLLDVNGTDFKWRFKAIGRSTDYQFRSYDRNEINLSRQAAIPNANDEYAAKFLSAASAYCTESNANEVILNVWNYDSRWKIEVKEDGKSLNVRRFTGKDPLHFLYSAKRVDKNKSADFSSNNNHMFKVTASSPTSTLEIKVTDRFGNEYTETMKRPKAFKEENYI